jgi:hypothetical protein
MVTGAPFVIKGMQERDRWLKMIVYGKPGIGKTELCATAVDLPAMNDVLLLNADRGDMTIYESPRIQHAELVNSVDVFDFKTAGHILNFLKAHCIQRDIGDIAKLKVLQAMSQGLDPKEGANIPDDQVRRYKTVIIDSLSELDAYSSYAILGIDESVIMSEEVDTAGWPEFRKNLERMKFLIREYRNLPMNVLFTCGEKFSQDENKKYHYTLSLTGQLAAAVQGFVDIVGWLVPAPATDSKPNPRRMWIDQVTGTGIPRYEAKNRRPSLKAPFLDDPTMATIMQGIGLVKPAASS